MHLFLAQQEDIVYVTNLYDTACDYLQRTKNYPLWRKGIYPSLQTAQTAWAKNELFIFATAQQRVGSVILNNTCAPAYSLAPWHKPNARALIIHTLVKDFSITEAGMGVAMVQCICDYAKAQGYDSIRLDVVAENTPAIKLYEKLGFIRIAKVDLQSEFAWTKWFYLYEKCL